MQAHVVKITSQILAIFMFFCTKFLQRISGKIYTKSSCASTHHPTSCGKVHRKSMETVAKQNRFNYKVDQKTFKKNINGKTKKNITAYFQF